MYRFPLIFLVFVLVALSQVNAKSSTAESDDSSVRQAGEDVIISDRERVELLEDSNLEEAVNRRPDLSFRNVTIDGEVATVSLKDIQANAVESAEVSKSVTPDLDADLRGGGLNLRSRPTYELKERVIRASLDSRYDPVLKSWDKDGSLTYGRSMGRWGFMLTGSLEKGPDATETYRQDWIQLSGPDGTEYVLEEQRFQHARTDETEFKANGTVDLQLNDNVRLYVKGDYRGSDREIYRPRVFIRYKPGSYEDISPNGAVVKGARLERLASSWGSDSSEYSMTTGGYLDFDNISIDYQVSLNDRGVMLSDMRSSKFTRRRTDLVYDLRRKYAPEFALLDSADDAINDPASYRSDWFSRVDWQTDNQVWLSTANIRIPVYRSWFNGYVKSGFKLRGLDFERDIWDEHYDTVNSQFTLDSVRGDARLSQGIGGLFDFGPQADNHAVASYFADNPEDFEYNLTRTREDSDPESYATSQDIYAGYSMVYFTLNGLRVIAGLRYEQTQLDYLANEVILDGEGDYLQTVVVEDDNRYSNWFPGIHGRYDLGRLSIIGSWSNTINRPDFALVVPYREVHREAEFIESGNPGLKPTLYTNYDLAVDYHLNGDDDLLSMELFYQTVDDIIYNEVSIVNTGPYAGYELETFKNGPNGDVYGMRFIWSQHLDPWLDFAKGFYFNATYTHRISETIYPARPEAVLPMPRRPKNSFQLNISYRNHGIFSQLELDYDEGSLREINDEAPWRDAYQEASIRLDFSSTYRISDGVRILFEVFNITESRRGESYYDGGNLLTRYQHSPRWYRLGMKFDL